MTPKSAAATVALAGLTLLPLAAGRGATAAEPSLAELLRSAGEYVFGYEHAFSAAVAEEVYVQRLRASPSGPVQETRSLSSDVVFVRAPGTVLPWWLLRDVYEADGRAVRDRQRRLEKLSAPTVVRGPDSHPEVLAGGWVWVHGHRPRAGARDHASHRSVTMRGVPPSCARVPT